MIERPQQVASSGAKNTVEAQAGRAAIQSQWDCISQPSNRRGSAGAVLPWGNAAQFPAYPAGVASLVPFLSRWNGVTQPLSGLMNHSHGVPG